MHISVALPNQIFIKMIQLQIQRMYVHIIVYITRENVLYIYGMSGKANGEIEDSLALSISFG